MKTTGYGKNVHWELKSADQQQSDLLGVKENGQTGSAWIEIRQLCHTSAFPP